MTPTAFRDAVASIGWSFRALADYLDCDDRLVRRWAAGAAEIPPAVAKWIEALARAHRAHPPPLGWRVRVPEAHSTVGDHN